MRTTDAGVHWESVMPPAGIFTVKFVDSRRGYIVSNRTIYRTTNGGSAWTSSQTEGYNLEALWFATSDSGFAAGVESIERTTDGGETWTDKPLPVSGLHAIAGRDRRFIVAVGDKTKFSPDLSKPEAGACVRSTDGGEHWTETYTNVPFTLMCVTVIGDSTVIAAGDRGITIRSTDLGTHWDTLSLNLPGDYFSSISQSPSGLLMLSGSAGELFFSRDSGASWRQADNVPVDDWIMSSTFVDDSTVIVVGDSGLIARATSVRADVAEAKGNSSSILVLAWPNPARDFTTLFTSATSLSVIDYSGRSLPVWEFRSESSSERKLDLSHYPPGHYLVAFTSGTTTESCNLLKLP